MSLRLVHVDELLAHEAVPIRLEPPQHAGNPLAKRNLRRPAEFATNLARVEPAQRRLPPPVFYLARRSLEIPPHKVAYDGHDVTDAVDVVRLDVVDFAGAAMLENCERGP